MILATLTLMAVLSETLYAELVTERNSLSKHPHPTKYVQLRLAQIRKILKDAHHDKYKREHPPTGV